MLFTLDPSQNNTSKLSADNFLRLIAKPLYSICNPIKKSRKSAISPSSHISEIHSDGPLDLSISKKRKLELSATWQNKRPPSPYMSEIDFATPSSEPNKGITEETLTL